MGISAISIVSSINKNKMKELEDCDIYGSDFESVNLEDYDLWLVSPQYKNIVNSNKIICVSLNDWNVDGCIKVIQKYLKNKENNHGEVSKCTF